LERFCCLAFDEVRLKCIYIYLLNCVTFRAGLLKGGCGVAWKPKEIKVFSASNQNKNKVLSFQKF